MKIIPCFERRKRHLPD